MPRWPLMLAAVLVPVAAAGAQQAADSEVVKRGEYVFHAAGCYGCHTDVKRKGEPLAGGQALKTPFGTFYAPNITPDPEHGIGGWSLASFTHALRKGISPRGSYYYPAFPFTAYGGMSDGDAADLWAYLQTVPASTASRKIHELDFPYSMRWTLGTWRFLNFRPESHDPDRPTPPSVADAQAWRRGAYLVRALSHCGECHTPRGALGARDAARELSGTPQGPWGEPVPNVTPHDPTGIGGWDIEDITLYLKLGMKPDGDFAQRPMSEVVEYSTGRLSDEDRRAIAIYLLSLTPVESRIEKTRR